MMLSLAPMEGLTGQAFRRVHAECFGKMDRYYTPFLMPPRVGEPFATGCQREIDPSNNEGLSVVPQLLTNDADEFVWAATLLAQSGYGEVNLNLGCPSGTVAAKGRGTGFLRNLDELEAFLQVVCERSPLPISVKTRLGLQDDAEFDQILDLYCRYPLVEVIVHPRVQKDAYKGNPRWERYGDALKLAPFPVAYSGDINCVDDLNRLRQEYPDTRHVMLGRGMMVNPALARMAQGGHAASLEELKHFHDRLLCEYEKAMGHNALFRMKEWWSYAERAFENPTSVHRALRKVKQLDEYRSAVRRVFRLEALKE